MNRTQPSTRNWVIAAVVMLVGLATMGVVAHEGKGGERLAKKLDLNETQSVQVKAIMTEQHKKMQAVHEEVHELLQTRMSPITEETRALLAQVLDDEQLARYDSMKAERKERKAKWRKHGERRQHRGQH